MSKKSADRSRAARGAALLAAQRRHERRRRVLVTGGIVSTLLCLVLVGAAVASSQDTTGETPDVVPAGVTADYGVVVGDPEAATEIVVYEDPQCPVCARFEAAVGDRLESAVAAGEASVEYRIVTFLDHASTNDYSSRAANALMAVHHTAGADAFARFQALLLERQTPEGGPGHDDDQLIRYAVEAGAEEGKVRPLVEDGSFGQWLRNATDAMSRNGVTGTPTVLVDGEQAADPVAGVVAALR